MFAPHLPGIWSKLRPTVSRADYGLGMKSYSAQISKVFADEDSGVAYRKIGSRSCFGRSQSMKLISFRCPCGHIGRLYQTGLEEVEPISLQTVKHVAEVAYGPVGEFN